MQDKGRAIGSITEIEPMNHEWDKSPGQAAANAGSVAPGANLESEEGSGINMDQSSGKMGSRFMYKNGRVDHPEVQGFKGVMGENEASEWIVGLGKIQAQYRKSSVTRGYKEHKHQDQPASKDAKTTMTSRLPQTILGFDISPSLLFNLLGHSFSALSKTCYKTRCKT